VKLRDERTNRARIRYALVAKPMAFQSPASAAAVEVGIGGTDSFGDPLVCSTNAMTCVAKSSSERCR